MKALGRNSGDSFRCMSSYSQSNRYRSYKRPFEQKTLNIHRPVKVRKHSSAVVTGAKSGNMWIIFLSL